MITLSNVFMSYLFTRVKSLKSFVSFVILLMMLSTTCLLFYTTSFTLQKYSWKPVNLPYVVVHIDLKGSPPRLNYLKTLLPQLRMNGVNGLLIEYEDMFPYEEDLANLSASYSYKKTELKKFLKLAHKTGFEVIPLIQTFGHMEFVLKLTKYQGLRESPIFLDSVCPSNNQSLELIKSMLKQVITLHDNIAPLKHIHIGCDEVFSINICKNCRLRSMYKIDIFLEHVGAVIEIIETLSPFTRVLIWDDMLRSIGKDTWDDIEHIPNLEIVYWDYKPKTTISQYNLFYYHQKFENIWISSAFKGADSRTATLPDLKTRYLNHYSWLNFIRGYKFYKNDKSYTFRGIILSGWSRYSHMDPACELLPVSLPSLILNLLLIDKYKRGVTTNTNDPMEYYTKYLQSELTHYLRCDTPVNLENIDVATCRFDGAELYKILFNTITINEKIMFTVHNNKSEYPLLEYYKKLKRINIYGIPPKLYWCNKYLEILNNLKHNITTAMSKYYYKEFIREYAGFKTYNSKMLKGLIKNMVDYLRGFSKKIAIS